MVILFRLTNFQVSEGPVHLVYFSASSRTRFLSGEYDTGAFRQVLGTEVGLSFFLEHHQMTLSLKRNYPSASTIAGTVPEFSLTPTQ